MINLYGIILSGGPNSVKDKKSPKLDSKILDQGTNIRYLLWNAINLQ